MSVEMRMARCLAVLTLLTTLLAAPTQGAGEPGANSVTVVYNHVGTESAADLQPGGGFGAFIEFDGKVILFDTGGQTDVLLQNIQQLKKDASRIEAVVISHNHWDHVYGLPGVLSVTRDRPRVYVPESSRKAILQQNPRGTIVAIDSPTQIMPKVWLTGPLELEYRGMAFAEQALVLEHGSGLIVLVGCSHPGIIDIVERVKELFEGKKILFVGGGFHLRSSPQDEIRNTSTKLRQHGVKQLAPSHCTGDEAMETFRKEWNEEFLSFNLGDSFSF
jgi:7,8-dihydropterin-6-yl-methyl-4-(beta-D-ribofuranosyl)aminobenzene 5'-phosphate synthase